ncbi:hypothetical protein BDZ91DRAFT_794163 [Kalaharituber pfeilii]|nr:hypothetical protein BDZ91DRAFT_794163 [Kalaharituber pfeilii]
MAAMPAAYLKKPEKGESYALNPSAAKTRLQAYAFLQGFLVLDYKATGGVSQDEPEKKLRQRQVLLASPPRRLQMGGICITKEGWKLDDDSIQKEWLLGVNELNHTLEMAENPFEDPEHLVFDQDYEKILAEAHRLNEAGVNHTQANNILLAPTG